MQPFEIKVLFTLYRTLNRQEVDSTPDGAILNEGRFLLADDWAGNVREVNGEDWAPRISLALGKLKRAGLVHSEAQEEKTYSHWGLTDEGQALAESIGTISNLPQ